MTKFFYLFSKRGGVLFKVSLAVTLGIYLIALLPSRSTLAAGTSCQTSGPASAAYTVTVCITGPVDGAVLTGDVTVTATASATVPNPGIQKLLFYLGGQYIIVDYASPYTFVLPTTKFVDGSQPLEVEAQMRDGFTSTRAGVNVTLNNGITQLPTNTNTYTIATGSAPAAGRPFILAATGDGASGEPNSDAVTDLIASWNPNMLLYLGDVYNDGTYTEFLNWYGSGANRYSRFRAITNPTVGNHEYQGLDAPDYFDYWNNVPHYYSFNVAGWHVISLDSTFQFNETQPGTRQYDWLVQDLNANTAVCTIAYFHHPVYNIGPEGYTPRMNTIWALLAQYGVDIVLTGHDHDYQRWYPLDGQGVLNPNGVTQFVVGTGGHGIQSFVPGLTDNRLAVGFDTPPSAFGALRLELNQSGAAYQYVNTQGLTLDSGSIPCSGAGPDTTAPSVPTNLTATSTTSTHVDLSWTSATDDVGVTNYDIYRNGTLIATTGGVTSYSDATVTGGTTYQYQVAARDAAGNVSGLSNTVTATASLLFSDGFEAGNLSKWIIGTGVTGLTVQQQEVYDGLYAARQTSTGAATWAYRQLSTAQNNLYYRLRFKIISMASNVYLLKFRTATGTSILGVYLNSSGKLAYRNDVANSTNISATSVSSGAWHDLQVHVSINGSSSRIDIWLDGLPISDLSKTEALGGTPIGRIQLGDNTGGRTYDVAFDNVVVDTNPIDMTPPTVTLTDPAANSFVREKVSLAANASDNVALDRVEFYVNGTLIGADYTAPYSVIWDSRTSTDGPVTITARAVDVGFNTTTSSNLVVTVDNTPPDTTITSGPSGTVNSDTATFTFTANEAGASLTCNLDGQDVEDCASPQTFNNLSAGSHTFEVVATDLAGNIDPTPATRTWTVTIPTSTSTPTLTSTPTATLTSTPTATATSTNTPTSTFTPTATSTPTNTPTATSTSTPTATSTSANSPTPVGAGTYDDGDPAWAYVGSWTTYSGSGPYNNTLHYTNVQNASAGITFTGTQFTVYFTKYPNRGDVEVWIDGVKQYTFSENSSSLAWQQSWTLPTPLSNGVHTVQFKNPTANSSTYIDIDAIMIMGPPQPVGPGTYDDTNPAWSYSGSWTAYTGSGPLNNTLHYTNVQNASAGITFTGTQFTIYFTKYPNRGNVEVWIDGSLVYTFNENGASLAWQQSWTLPTPLSNGVHTVQFKNPSANTAVYIDIDAIQIMGPVPAGTYDDTNPAWNYSGSWTNYSSSGPYNNTLHYTNVQTASASITFTGTQFTVYFTKYPNRGDVEVWIDGGKLYTFSENSTSLAWQQSWTLPTPLTNGMHTVQFKNPNASTSTYIDIDAIIIFP